MSNQPDDTSVRRAPFGLHAATACMLGVASVISQPSAAQEHNAIELSRTGQVKSERTALALSLIGTVVPVGLGALSASENASNQGADVLLLIVGGLAVGPSLGHYYAGRPLYATGTAVLRGAMAEVVALNVSCETNCADALLVVPGSIVLVSIIADIATAPAAVRAHKRRLNLTPVAAPRAGVGVVGTVTF